jgi:hypothetical protein
MLEVVDAILSPERDVLIQGAIQLIATTVATALLSCRQKTFTWTDFDP